MCAIELQYPLSTYSVDNPPSNETLKGDLSTVQTASNANETAIETVAADLAIAETTASDALAAQKDVVETLTNKTLTLPKINENVAVTATATEINVLDGIPATLTATELGYVDGVTSAIQTQINTKSPIASPTFTTQATSPRYTSTVATGTQPYACTSTTLNTNLNADTLDGYHASEIGKNPASASAPASLDLHEDTDNGTNKITIIAPSAVASDKTITLPDATGEVVLKDTTDTLTNKILSTGSVVPAIYVTNPYRASAYASAAQLNLTDNTYTKVALNTEEHDPNNNFDSTTNYRYTAPVSGYYHIIGQVGLSGTDLADLKLLTVAIYKDGVANKISFTPTGLATATHGQVAATIYLAATNYVELFVRIANGNNLADTFVAGNSTFMTIDFLGA